MGFNSGFKGLIMFQRIRLRQLHFAGHENKEGGRRKVWEQERRNVKQGEVNEEGEQDKENNHKNNSMMMKIKNRIVAD